MAECHALGLSCIRAQVALSREQCDTLFHSRKLPVLVTHRAASRQAAMAPDGKMLHTRDVR